MTKVAIMKQSDEQELQTGIPHTIIIQINTPNSRDFQSTES